MRSKQLNAHYLTVCMMSTFLMVGCQVFSHHHQSGVSNELSANHGFAKAREGFLRGQKLNILGQGLSLDSALARSLRPGAFQGTDPDDFAQLFVVLMRGSTRMFIPLALVQNNQAGSIQLRHGDHIEVLDIEDVGLFDDRMNPNDPNSPTIPAGSSFQWSGLVSSPGRFSTTKDGQRLKDDPPEFFGNLRGGADVLVLTRQNATLTDEYVIPEGDRRFGQFWRIDRRIPLRDGDQILATRLALIDIIRAGAKQSQKGNEIVRRAELEESDRHFTKLQETHEAMNQNSFVRGVRVAGATLKRRISQIPIPSLTQ